MQASRGHSLSTLCREPRESLTDETARSRAEVANRLRRVAEEHPFPVVAQGCAYHLVVADEPGEMPQAVLEHLLIGD